MQIKLSRILAAALLTGIAALPATAAHAQDLFSSPERSQGGKVSFAAAEKGKPIIPGSAIVISGEGYQPGQSVELLYGQTSLPTGGLIANAEGKFEARFDVPANAAIGSHPIIAVTKAPYAAAIVQLKISPDIPLSGAEMFDIRRAPVTQGLYQSAYSAKSGALFVTSAVGRPPVKQSELLRLDAKTLAITARVTPGAAPAREGPDGQPQDGGVFAVYGVGVDDANGNVWVSNSRQNTVAVYRQSDLALVRQFDAGTVNHARDVIVEQKLGKAYASATFAPEVVVFDAGKLEVAKRIAIKSKQRGEDFSAASLSLDSNAHRLYVVSNSTNEVAVIDTASDEVLNVFAIPGARSAIGVSHDPMTGHIYIAAQGSDNLIVLDGTNGTVISDTPVGAGALNVVFDPIRRQAFVSNRGSGSITVVDTAGKIVANLGPAPMANHVATDGKGDIFAVTKGTDGQEDANSLWHISPKKK